MVHSFNCTDTCYFFYYLLFGTQMFDIQVSDKLEALACSVGHIQNRKHMIFLVILLLQIISYIRKAQASIAS